MAGSRPLVRARTRDATVDEAWQLGPSSLKRPRERATRVLPSCRRERGCVTAVAPRPILILPSQAKVTGRPRGHRCGRGRATSVGFAATDEPTGAAGFAVASDAGGRPRAAGSEASSGNAAADEVADPSPRTRRHVDRGWLQPSGCSRDEPFCRPWHRQSKSSWQNWPKQDWSRYWLRRFKMGRSQAGSPGAGRGRR